MSPATGTQAAPTPKTLKEIVESQPTQEEIRQRAYEIHVSRGDSPGDELQDWLEAERELRGKQPPPGWHPGAD
jgi:hypothetical protein